MPKALLIKSYTTKAGSQGVWNNLDDATSYIQGINTGKVLEDLNADKLSALISGVPSPWARAKLFKLAFDTIAVPDPNIEESGLMTFYKLLEGEWKGLLAVMALYPDRIKISEPIYMDPKGQDYDLAAAFGRMLFDDRDVWSCQADLINNPDAKPYIQLIYYKGILVGGTSPLTGIFTGIKYDLKGEASDINWYREGKFQDPTNMISGEQLQKVYLFVKNLCANVSSFEEEINRCRGRKLKIELKGLKAIVRMWERDIKTRGANNLKEIGPTPKYAALKPPFSILLKSEIPVYLKPDNTFTYTKGADYFELKDIQELLSEDKFVIGWQEADNPGQSLANAPVYFLKTFDITENKHYYFTLPLSEKAIDVFKNQMSSLLGYGQNGNTILSAKITDAGKLLVSFTVEIDGQSVSLNDREYEIHWPDDPNPRVILWPNFTSEKWTKYYLYTEFTSAAAEQFRPIFKTGNDFIKDDDLGKRFFIPNTFAPDECKNVSCKKIIKYERGAVEEDMPKYEIYTSDKPVAGLSAMVSDAGKPSHAGYLVVRKDLIKDLSNVSMKGRATVGIDFGSNNTCVYYNESNKGAKPVEFDNLRAMLVGVENNDRKAVAQNDELLFLSNTPAHNGQVKSWLHEHDSRYNKNNESEEIAGGVPVNRPNVLVKEMDRYAIKTQAGILNYNMKWLDASIGDGKGQLKKEAFLKTLWIQACACLYKDGIWPETIFWSYPGSMMESDKNALAKIFDNLGKITPIKGVQVDVGSRDYPEVTEAEAVCCYALSKGFDLRSDNLILGIDVGGSTTDILLLAKDPISREATLFRESSVRIAAGAFFDAVIGSQSFREALVSFHESHKTRVHVENIAEIRTEKNKAPYYLNSIFDQLSPDEYEDFYDSIANNARFVFTIPAYVTGILLFYSGMLAGKTIKDNHLELKSIELMPFGNGGKLFHWLRNTPNRRVAEDYYDECFNAGLSLVCDIHLKVNYHSEIESENKSEVARGLCSLTELKKDKVVTSDICGEAGVHYIMPDGSNREIAVDDELLSAYFDKRMSGFEFTSTDNFQKFMEIFIDLVSRKGNLFQEANRVLRDDIDDLKNKISSTIQEDSEYKKAVKNIDDGFNYHQPIIIAEGMGFLNTLIRKVFNK